MNPPFRVIVAGGGVAGLEALLALHDLAGDRVDLTLLAPDADFVYRPMAVAEPFSLGHRQHVPLADVGRDVGARVVRDGLARVDEAAGAVHTTAGEVLPYDALLVATGARLETAIDDALTWGPDSDPDQLGGLLRGRQGGRARRGVEGGYPRRVAFVIPSEAAWPLPAYELALMTAREARGMGRTDVEVIVVTPEDEPLGLFGKPASEAVQATLAAAGLRVETGSYVSERAAGALRLEPGGRHVEVDRVVALPRVAGPAVPGLPHDQRGFIP